MNWFLLPAWVPGALLGLVALEGWMTHSRLRDLPQLPEADRTQASPSICLCIPARNEVREIGPALDSWLAQDYPGLRVLVVDDGSTDGTAAILAERSSRHPERLRVLRNDVLPPGWLGKNHALHLASAQAEALAADWLLFVDADVNATPDLLLRCTAHLREFPADLLTLIAAVETVSLSERIFIPAALLQFLWATPPRRVADPHSAFFCGTGGFTLVRRKAYEAIGGHAEAPMEAVDDMRLAQRMKRAGFLNRMARGGPALRLRMYHGLSEILRALRKNLLSLDYLWLLAPLLILVLLALSLSPVWLALGGWPMSAMGLWILWPVLIGEAYQKISARPMDWIWILWPLSGLIAATGMAWAFLDRLRGVNHWRGRNVRIR
jgi:glycosyltransferase involved in cell wall biosynthesis